MTDQWASLVARRPFLTGLLAFLGVAALGGIAIEIPALTHRNVPAGPFGRLLAKLSDQASAARVGVAIVADHPKFDDRRTAQILTTRLEHKSLEEVLMADIAEKRLVEVRGWILPETLAGLCALATKAA